MLNSRQRDISELTLFTCRFNILWIQGEGNAFPVTILKFFTYFNLATLVCYGCLIKKYFREKIFRTQVQTTYLSTSYDANIVNHAGQIYSLRNNLMRMQPFLDKIRARVSYCRRQTPEKIYSRRQTPHIISSQTLDASVSADARRL